MHTALYSVLFREIGFLLQVFHGSSWHSFKYYWQFYDDIIPLHLCSVEIGWRNVAGLASLFELRSSNAASNNSAMLMFSHLKIYINMKADWKSYCKKWVSFSLLTVSIAYAFHISLIQETLVVASLHNVPSNDLFPIYYLHCTCFFVSLRRQPLVVTNVHNGVPLSWLQN